jgi:hypothetical protein
MIARGGLAAPECWVVPAEAPFMPFGNVVCAAHEF